MMFATPTPPIPTDDYYCELPIVPLGIRTRAAYRSREILRAVGFLESVRPAWPRPRAAVRRARRE
jgi:hypothetical protein